jgi:hypothetical protein
MDMISTDVEEGTVMIFDKRLSIREARELRNQLNEFLFVTGGIRTGRTSNIRGALRQDGMVTEKSPSYMKMEISPSRRAS